jgi:hypothetical protein
MITSLPSVQHSIKRAYRHIHKDPDTARWHKTLANRRFRRALNALTRRFVLEPERFDNETFHAPSLSAWDID